MSQLWSLPQVLVLIRTRWESVNHLWFQIPESFTFVNFAGMTKERLRNKKRGVIPVYRESDSVIIIGAAEVFRKVVFPLQRKHSANGFFHSSEFLQGSRIYLL